MDFEVAGHLGAVERSTSLLERDDRPASAAGTDPAAARAAARRTTAFYTGEPAEPDEQPGPA